MEPLPPTPFADGFWGNIKLALRRGYSMGGRSTRAEFWWFTLFCVLAPVPFLALASLAVRGLLGLAQSSEGSGDIFAIIGWVSLGGLSLLLAALTVLLLIVPWHMVLVRRMHDIGKKGWGVFVSLVLNMLVLGGCVLIYRVCSFVSSVLHGGSDLAPIVALILGMPVVLLLFFALIASLLVFINCLRPSQPAPNPYGIPATPPPPIS